MKARFKQLYRLSKEKISKSIRIQLILTFAICLVAGGFVTGLSHSMLQVINSTPYIDYTGGMDRIDLTARQLVYQFDREAERNIQPNQEGIIQQLIDRQSQQGKYKMLVVDLSGKVLLKPQTATETQVDIHNAIRNAMEVRRDNSTVNGTKDFYSVYPVTVSGTPGYVVVSGVPEGQIRYRQVGEPFSWMLGVAAFVVLFYFLTRKKMRYIEELADGLLAISKGNLQYRVTEKSRDELGSLAANINLMAAELESKIESERQTEKVKNELITNVSHDLRTPLTSIMGYLRLLMNRQYENEHQMQNYFQIVYGKTERLQALIEDLFEYTKLTDKETSLSKETVCLNELIEQMLDELIPLEAEHNVNFSKQVPAERIYMSANPDAMARLLENLLSNAIKYSHKPAIITVELKKEAEHAVISVQNKGDSIPQQDLPRLFERFYRVDKARAEGTGGTGLGLAIAKSIVELHEGRIWAESEDGETRFFVQFTIQ